MHKDIRYSIFRKVIGTVSINKRLLNQEWCNDMNEHYAIIKNELSVCNYYRKLSRDI
jgi:hypothetical protein